MPFRWSISFLLEILVCFRARISHYLAIGSRFSYWLSLIKKSLCCLTWCLGKHAALIWELVLFIGSCSDWWKCCWTSVLWRCEIVGIVWVCVGMIVAALATLSTYKVWIRWYILRQALLTSVLISCHWVRFWACHSCWRTIVKLKCILDIVSIFSSLRLYNAIGLCHINLLLSSKNILGPLSATRLSSFATFVLIACFLKFANVRFKLSSIGTILWIIISLSAGLLQVTTASIRTSFVAICRTNPVITTDCHEVVCWVENLRVGVSVTFHN